MYKNGFLAVAVLAIVLAFSLVIPHPAHASDQNVTLRIEGMT